MRNYTIGQWQRMLEESGFQPGALSTFRLRLEFSSWIERMQTPEAHIRAIRSLQAMAGSAVGSHFEIETDGSFTLDSMLMIAKPCGADRPQ